MIWYGLLIWVGINAGMPTGYFVACGFGMAIKALTSLIDAVYGKS